MLLGELASECRSVGQAMKSAEAMLDKFLKGFSGRLKQRWHIFVHPMPVDGCSSGNL
jgi:hypothetical protein